MLRSSVTVALVVVASAFVALAPTASAGCTNYGVQIDVNSPCSGPCENHGAVVWIGASCWGYWWAGGCLSNVCVPGDLRV